MSRKPTNAAAGSEAVRWFHRFRVNGHSALPSEESADWARWSADAAQLDEFCRAKQLWQKLGVLSVIARPTQEDLAADEYDPSISIRDWLARCNAKESPR